MKLSDRVRVVPRGAGAHHAAKLFAGDLVESLMGGKLVELLGSKNVVLFNSYPVNLGTSKVHEPRGAVEFDQIATWNRLSLT
jgi:hypothetical protein